MLLVVGAALLALAIAALALAWRDSVTSRPLPSGPAIHRADIASAHAVVLYSYTGVKENGGGGGGGGNGGGGNGQGGNGQGGNGQGTATPELPSGVLFAVGLVPLAIAVGLIALVRRRRDAIDAG